LKHVGASTKYKHSDSEFKYEPFFFFLKTREPPHHIDRAEARNNPERREAPRSGAMVVRRLGGAGRALLTLPNIRRRASNSWAAVRDTFFSTKVTTDDLAAAP